MNGPPIDALRELDPAGPRLGPAAAPDDPTLMRIVSTPRDPSPRPRRRPVAALTAAAALAVAGIVVLPTLLSPGAYATWSPEPDELTAEQVQLRVDACGDQSWLPPDEPRTVDTVLVDVRGEHSFVLRSDGEQYVSCYLETTIEGEITDMTAANGRVGPAPSASGLTTLNNGVSQWSDGWPWGPSGAATLAYGRAGELVASVEVTFEGGEVVTATVEDGWWAVWTPGERPIVGDRATVELADGTRSETSIDVYR